MITTIVIIICEETSKTMWISPARWGKWFSILQKTGVDATSQRSASYLELKHRHNDLSGD